MNRGWECYGCGMTCYTKKPLNPKTICKKCTMVELPFWIERAVEAGNREWATELQRQLAYWQAYGKRKVQ